MAEPLTATHPAATGHLPHFVTAPGESDVLMTVMAVFLLVILLTVGNLYLKLHSLPERMAHRTKKVQFQIVAVLGLLALFTHNHAFWIAALLLALIDLPDFTAPLRSMSRSLERLADREAATSAPPAVPPETVLPAPSADKAA